nr:hypothetical protein [Dendronalium sp. ChiSLP03b]
MAERLPVGYVVKQSDRKLYWLRSLPYPAGTPRANGKPLHFIRFGQLIILVNLLALGCFQKRCIV